MNTIYAIKKLKILGKINYIQRNLFDPESIRNSKKSSDLLKWIHSNGVMNLSVVITCLIVDSIIHSIILRHLGHSIQKGEIKL